MSDALERYRKLEESLREIRHRRPPGSEEEYPIIEEGAEVWWKLTEDERAAIDAEGPTCWSVAFSDGSTLIENDVWGGPAELLPRQAGKRAF